MSFAPYAALWLVLVAAAVTSLLTDRRPRVLVTVTLAAPLLALILWLLPRPNEITPALSVAERQWAISAAGWQLTGIVLLLALTAAVHTVMNRPPARTGRQSALLPLLAAASLSLIWAADDRTRLMGLALFAAVWGGATFAVGRERATNGNARPFMPWIYLIAVFPLWLAGALPAGRIIFGLLAALIMFVGRGCGIERNDDAWQSTLIMLHGLPLVGGTAILVATLYGTMPSTLEITAGTVIGLFLLVGGLIYVWKDTPAPATLAFGLTLAGLSLTAAVWTGQETLVAGIRLAVFVPTLLILAAALPSTSQIDSPVDGVVSGRRFSLVRRVTPGSLGTLIAYIVVGGFPFAAGFFVLASLFTTWWAAGGWILLFVTAVLWCLLLAALIINALSLAKTGQTDRDAWLRGIILLLPIIGLLSLNVMNLDTGWMAWAAIGVIVLAGLAVGLFVSGGEGLGDSLREAVALPQPAVRVASGLRRTGSIATGGLAEGLAILNGEYGLLWIFGLILLLLWIT